jgi:hypothetical protein
MLICNSLLDETWGGKWNRKCTICNSPNVRRIESKLCARDMQGVEEMGVFSYWVCDDCEHAFETNDIPVWRTSSTNPDGIVLHISSADSW